MLMDHPSLISLIPPIKLGPLFNVQISFLVRRWSQVFLREVTILQPLTKLDH